MYICDNAVIKHTLIIASYGPQVMIRIQCKFKSIICFNIFSGTLCNMCSYPHSAFILSSFLLSGKSTLLHIDVTQPVEKSCCGGGSGGGGGGSCSSFQ
jgi:hypothetical protein